MRRESGLAVRARDWPKIAFGRDLILAPHLHLQGAVFRQRQPRQNLPGRHAVAGLGLDFRDLQARPLRANSRFLLRNQDAGHLDDIGKARFHRLQHRDRRALGGVLGRIDFFGGEGWVQGETEQGGSDWGEPFAREAARGAR